MKKPEEMTTEELLPYLEELARRFRQDHPNAKTAEEAWQDFVKYYLPRGDDDLTDEELLLEHMEPARLTPSVGGKECLANGSWPGYPSQCPDCDYYETVCFPKVEVIKKP